MRTRVYVAGAISKGCLKHNLLIAREAGTTLLRAGYAPFVPHLSVYWNSDTPDGTGNGFDHATWLEMDLSWVSTSHALFRLPGESKGADMEVHFAYTNRIPVFFDLDLLMKIIPAKVPFEGFP